MSSVANTHQNSGKSLAQLRDKLDHCDNQIIELISRRFELVREIGSYKNSCNLPVVDKTRERHVLSQRVSQAPRGSSRFINDLFKLIISESCRIQEDMNKPPDTCSFEYNNVAVIGLGLIGTSICLALKKAGGNSTISGYDIDQDKTKRVSAMGVIDRIADGLPDCVRQADIVIVAVPVRAVKPVLEMIAPHLKTDTIVLDTGSSKGDICRWADSILPQHVSFVGGHPLAGKTDTSLESADADLFRQRLFVVTPSNKTNDKALSAARQLIGIIGAEEVIMPTADHDQQAALISHLPFLLSSSLLSAVTKHGSWPEAKRLAATGFHDVSRLASGDPDMYTDICITNHDNILKALALFSAALTQVEEAISREDVESLRSIFTTARKKREEWLSDVSNKRRVYSSP